MFKKLKDKLAEEVKSSPQRIQQFAQAAQAAVTSASSSISDITNNDLFSIGDSDNQQNQTFVKTSPSEPKYTFQDVTLAQAGNQPITNSMDIGSNHDCNETQRQRRLSNSSFTSDISFKLPSYESPSMYHLQSDMEVSASEADERGFSSGAVSLDRVTKEQIYAAYRRTQERYSKYRTQYADLARHYKLLERENAKAKSVLVETQDKALRRISELREQCALEQSAKAHLEKALRVEMEEKNIKIDTLNTKIQFLQSSNSDVFTNQQKEDTTTICENNMHLISFDNENSQMAEDPTSTEIVTLNTKIEKLEKLVNKYKDSLKSTKEKNGHLTTEIQIMSTELEAKCKEIRELKISQEELDATKKQVQELNELNEQLQNKINAFDFNKSKELTTLELDLAKSQDEIAQLRGRIEVFTKREEEYAISLAENKLSIHKELEGKESEIKTLKDKLSESKQEIQSLNIVITDYKNKITQLEDENVKHRNDSAEINLNKTKLTELESQIQALSQKCANLENSKAKVDEEYKCLQLQLKQETAEKLAMIDRNTYLEERNSQLTEENGKKSSQIRALDNDLQNVKKEIQDVTGDSSEKQQLLESIALWKNKFSGLEAEMQEERDELVKLQSEIEKLLANDERLQIQNSELNIQLNNLISDNDMLLQKLSNMKSIKNSCQILISQVKDLQKILSLTSAESKELKEKNNQAILTLKKDISSMLEILPQSKDIAAIKNAYEKQKSLHYTSRMELTQVTEENQIMSAELNLMKEENKKFRTEINNYDLMRHKLQDELQQAKDELQSLKNEQKIWEEKLYESNAKYDQLQNSLDKNSSKESNLKQEIAIMVDKIKKLEQDNISLNVRINKLKEEQKENVKKITYLEGKNKSLLVEYKNYLEEKQLTIENLQQNMKDLTQENILLSTQSEKNAELNKGPEDLILQINTLKEENTLLANKYKNDVDLKQLCIEELQHNINNLIQENVSLKTQCDENSNLEQEKENIISQISSLKEENNLLINKNERIGEEKQLIIEKLQENVKDLSQENISLKTQSEKIKNSVKDLELELSEVRKSHADIEVEKDRLNAILDQLEKSQQENDTTSKDTQTETKEATKTEKAYDLSNLLTTQHTGLNKPDNTEAYNLLLSSNVSLKEENKRLQSDVSGLQAYLTKISKENSDLNDKLRDLIACSEHSSDKNGIEIKLKEKLDDLTRENSLLIEENLELKDQLNSQNYILPAVTSEQDQRSGDYLNLQEKYNSIMSHNKQLEKRMLELETMNKAVNGNMMQIQEKNDKLRLTNEKLERRLDEALVSLRHLHSLQENTELEYLRNILFEYLTGTGAHSITLAKVLAAVVKFDERQTKQVLQKEKERQGLLRQLGII